MKRGKTKEYAPNAHAPHGRLLKLCGACTKWTVMAAFTTLGGCGGRSTGDGTRALPSNDPLGHNWTINCAQSLFLVASFAPFVAMPGAPSI